jgi:signal transduction histidine kinase/CheY-like chemotaxis protein
LFSRALNSIRIMFADRHRRVGLTLTIGGVALLTIAAALATALLFKVANATEWLEHSYIVRANISRLLTEIDGVELNARDRLPTNSAASGRAYAANRNAIENDLTELRKLVSDNKSQVARIDRLRTLTDAQLHDLDPLFEAAEPTQDRHTGLPPATTAGFAAVHDLLDNIDDSERALLARRRHNTDMLAKGLLGAMVFCLALAALVTVSVFRTNWSYLEELRGQTEALMAESESRKKAEGLFLQAQKLETIGQLTAGIAHDFNNLLTIVIGNLDNARMRLDAAASRDRVARSLELASDGAQRAATLTQRLLAFSRQQPLAPRPVDLNKTVAGISEVLRRTVGETITIETVLAGGLWPAFADPHQVENVIVNLVVNARDAMPDGGRITIETANAHLDENYVAAFGDVTAGQYAMFSVTDTGLGIPAEILPKVFDPFFTTKEVGKGTGLGLAMIHGFVKQSRGHMRIYSEEGQGTIVKIYLPRHSQALEPAAAPAVAADTGEAPRASDGEVVLMVEDDDGVREFAHSALESLGYRVLAGRDAAEALALLRNAERVDLMFTDVVLPGGINGRQFSEQARALRPSLPILFTTGYTRNAIVHGGRLDPDVRLLSKPYTRDLLARAVRNVIEESRSPA